MPGEENIDAAGDARSSTSRREARDGQGGPLQGPEPVDRHRAGIAARARRRAHARRRPGAGRPGGVAARADRPRGRTAGEVAQRQSRQALLHAVEPRHEAHGRRASPTPRPARCKTLIEERLNTYIESRPLRLVNNGQELLLWSERDGWGHFYLYDANTGALKNRITEGRVRHDRRSTASTTRRTTLFITAVGREKGEDPYYHAPLSRRARRQRPQAAQPRATPRTR